MTSAISDHLGFWIKPLPGKCAVAQAGLSEMSLSQCTTCLWEYGFLKKESNNSDPVKEVFGDEVKEISRTESLCCLWHGVSCILEPSPPI